MAHSDDEVTALLSEMKGHDSQALAKLVPLVYRELKGLAAHFLQEERQGHTLQPTALVHEVYLRLSTQNAKWQNRAHFMAIAGQLMRRILVDYARQRVATKRGGHEQRFDLDECDIAVNVEQSEEILAID